MRRFVEILSIIVFFCFISSRVLSKEVQINDILELNPEIFSLSKKKENAFDAPSATYILSSEEIRRSGATSIPEALRLAPGVQVSRMNGHSYAITIRGFNRQYSNRILVLIDGRTVFTSLFGVPWHIYDYILEDIDRIEIIRGAAGSIWGAGAVNGVINIITKSAIQTQGIYVSQIIGNQDKSITEVRYGGETKSKNNYRIYAKKAIRDGLDRHDTKQENRDGLKHEMIGFRYDDKSFFGGSLSSYGDIFNNDARNYFTNLNTSTNGNVDSLGGNISTNWEKKVSKFSDIILRGYITYNRFDTSILNINEKIYDIDFQHFYDFSENNKFSWGVGHRQTIYDIREKSTTSGITQLNYSPNFRDDQLFTFFLRDRIGLITDKLYLTLGSKFEHNDFTGFEYQPSARLAYYPAENQTLWTAISRAVRTPTIAEEGLELKSTNSNTTLNIGNSSYESEELLAYEVGYKIKPSSKTMIDITSFYNDYRKLRTFEDSPNGPITSNLGYGESYGFEISGKWQVTNKLKLEASYDYLNLDLHVSDNSTDRITVRANDALEVAEGQAPHNQFKLKSFYNISPKLEFDNFLYYVDNLPSAGATPGDKGVPSYFRLDTRLGYLPNQSLDLSIGIQNLFDQRYSEFKSSLYNRQTEVGRTAYLKLVYQY